MPDLNEEFSADAQKALIERMTVSSAFARSHASAALLRFLFDHREKPIMGTTIEIDFLKLQGHRVDAGIVRAQVVELKKRIEKYLVDAPSESIRCVLPDAASTGGYQLRFERTEGISASHSFWSAHLHSDKEVPVVCSRLLFYWDDTSGMMFHFMDANIEGLGKEEALEVLRLSHKKHHKESLIPGHLYIDAGSIAAAERVRDYFRISKRHVPLIFDKFSNMEWLKSSPIIIGNIRNTPSMKRILGSAAAEHLAYRLDDKRFCGITIKNPTNHEVKALKSIGVALDAQGSFCEPFTKVTIGIVTRIPNPRGAGVMTFVSSDGTFTTEQLAVALTDETQVRAIFTKMGWRLAGPIPERFELMFKARLWPGDSDDQATDVELICGRA